MFFLIGASKILSNQLINRFIIDRLIGIFLSNGKKHCTITNGWQNYEEIFSEIQVSTTTKKNWWWQISKTKKIKILLTDYHHRHFKMKKSFGEYFSHDICITTSSSFQMCEKRIFTSSKRMVWMSIHKQTQTMVMP